MAVNHRNGIKMWALGAVVAVVAVGVAAQGIVPGAVRFPNPSRSPISFGSGTPANLGSRNVAIAARPNRRPGGAVTRNRPSCAQGQEFCENDPEYPRNYIRQLVGRRANIVNLFTDPLLNGVLSDPATSAVPEQPVTRFGITETPACKATETLIYPQRGKRANSDWVFIVNDENIQQAVRVEKCTRENSSCEFGNNLPQSIDATCRQKYIYRKLLVLDSTNELAPESVLMPSCCVCYIKRSQNNIRGRNLPFTERFPTSPAGALTASLVPQPPSADGINFNG